MIWPAYTYAGRVPEVSHEFEKATHPGLDIGWRWRQGDPDAPPDTDPHRHWTIIGDARVLACEDGQVLYSELRARGWAIRIRSGPIDYCYFHGRAGTARVKEHDQVAAGAELVVIGADPLDRGGWRHIHLETRRVARKGETADGWGRTPVDPWPALRQAGHTEAPKLG